MNNNDGPASTALVLEWVGKYPELRPIAYHALFLIPNRLILKAFIARLDFDSVYTGGLGGFALLNMIVSLLQQHSILASQKGNLGRILVQFFQTYGLDFDYDSLFHTFNQPLEFAISVRLKAYIPKPAEVVRTRYIPPPVVTTNAATSPSIPISATHSPSTPSPASGAAPGIKSYSSAAAKSPPAPATISYSSVATKPVSPTAPIIPSYSNAVAASPSTPASIKKIGVSNLEINDASNSSPIINVATYPTSTYSNPPLAQPPADYNLRLYIEDPTDTSNNVCKSTFRMGEIRAAFLSVFQSLSTSLRLDQIVWVDPEVTRVREKLRKDWLAYSTPPPRASHMSTHSTGTQTYKKGDDRDRSKHRGKPGVRAASSSGHRDAPVAVNDGVSLGRGRGGKNRLRRHSSPSRGGGVNYATVAGSGRGLRPATFGSVALGVERGRTGGREKKGRKDVDGIVEGVRGVSVSETL